MRDYPEAVRSAVLDSTYPLEVNLYTTLAPNAERAFNVFFDDCAADPTCNTSYPNLRTVFYNLVKQLNASPVTVSISVHGSNTPVRLTGDLLIDVQRRARRHDDLVIRRIEQQGPAELALRHRRVPTHRPVVPVGGEILGLPSRHVVEREIEHERCILPVHYHRQRGYHQGQ